MPEYEGKHVLILEILLNFYIGPKATGIYKSIYLINIFFHGSYFYFIYKSCELNLVSIKSNTVIECVALLLLLPSLEI